MAVTGTILVAIGARTQNFQKGMVRARAGIRSLRRTAKGTTAGLKGMATSIIGITAAIQGFRKVVNTLKDFQFNMNRVAALTQATAEQFEQLEGLALHLGETTEFSSSQAAEAMTKLAQAGLSVNQIMGAVAGTLDLAGAGQIGLAEAAKISAQVLKGANLEVSELARVNDILAFAQSRSLATVGELGEAMAKVIPIATQTNNSLEDITAIVASFADVALEGSTGGIQFRRGLINVATGAGQAGKMLKSLGIETADAAGRNKTLIDILFELEERLKNVGQATRITALENIFGARATAGFLSIFGKGIQSLKDFSNEMKNVGGTAARIRKRQLKGFIGAWTRMTSALDNTAIVIGKILEPVLIGMADTIKAIVIPGVKLFGSAFLLLFKGLFTIAKLALNAIPIIVNGIINIIADSIFFIAKLFSKFAGIIDTFFLTPTRFLLKVAVDLWTGYLRIVNKIFGKVGDVIIKSIAAAIKFIAKQITSIGASLSDFTSVPGIVKIGEQIRGFGIDLDIASLKLRKNFSSVEKREKAIIALNAKLKKSIDDIIPSSLGIANKLKDLSDKLKAGKIDAAGFREQIKLLELGIVSFDDKIVKLNTDFKLPKPPGDKKDGEGGVVPPPDAGGEGLEGTLSRFQKFAIQYTGMFEVFNGRIKNLDEQRNKALIDGAKRIGPALTTAFQGQNERMFKIGKAFAIAQASVNTFLAVTAALALGPKGFILAAALAAEGFAQIRNIKATTFNAGGGGSTGGGVGRRGGAITDTAAENVQPSAAAQQQAPTINNIEVRGFVGNPNELMEVIGRGLEKMGRDNRGFGFNFTGGQ